jgi:8-oxo-dGTP diphosphatase
MKIIPVALALFYRQKNNELEVWVQRREDDGIYHGLLEFPGGKIEEGETPLAAAIREVEEEVGIKITDNGSKFMGVYPNELENRTILLYVILFPDTPPLSLKGQWLKISEKTLSSTFKGQIPGPNHRIIDDLYISLYDGAHE